MSKDIIEIAGRAIYCDGSYAQYEDGTPAKLGANDSRWSMISETQRQFCRAQAKAAIRALEAAGYRLVGTSVTL